MSIDTSAVDTLTSSASSMQSAAAIAGSLDEQMAAARQSLGIV